MAIQGSPRARPAATGITAGAIYRYFANKEDVIEACAQARGQAQEELHPAMEPGAAARLLVAAYVGLLVQKVMDPDVDVPKCAEALSALYRGDFRRGGSPTSDGKS